MKLPPPVHESGAFMLWNGETRDVLRGLPAESVDCVVTSPPYWSLRDYKLPPSVWGGAFACDHEWGAELVEVLQSGNFNEGMNERMGRASGDRKQERMRAKEVSQGQFCFRCGAWHGQLGLEPTPQLYVEHLVEVFREVRRVLAPHGTAWLNLGDSFMRDHRKGQHRAGQSGKQEYVFGANGGRAANGAAIEHTGLKPKDLVGIPWRVALALQKEGWCLRSDVVWSKPNPMPESVTDRPSKSHEMVFLLTKSTWKGPERGRFEFVSDEDARWLALLIDTEGNICLKRARREGKADLFGAQVAVANTSRELIDRVRSMLREGSVSTRPQVKGNAPVHYFQVSGKSARDLLVRIYPYLIVKPRQARVVIHAETTMIGRTGKTRHRSAEEEAALVRAWEAVKSCNSFGDPDVSWAPEPKRGRWEPNDYYFDQEAVRVKPADSTLRDKREARAYGGGIGGGDASAHETGRPVPTPSTGRNLRSVWEIPTQPFSAKWLGFEDEDHFAVFPEELARTCIEASCPRWVCALCGTPRYRLVARRSVSREELPPDHPEYRPQRYDGGKVASEEMPGTGQRFTETRTLGWTECPCSVGQVVCRTCDHSIPYAPRGSAGEEGVQPGSVPAGQGGQGSVPHEGLRGPTVSEEVHGAARAGDVLAQVRDGEADRGGEASRPAAGDEARELQGPDDHEGRLRDGLPSPGPSVQGDGRQEEPGDGAQARDGGVPRQAVDAARGGAPSEREAGGQQASEPEARRVRASRRKRDLPDLPGHVLHPLTCPSCGGSDFGWDGLPSDSFAPILSPLGDGEEEDPSMETGRAGMNRPRNDGEGVRVMTRYEQRQYAEQLRLLRSVEHAQNFALMEAEVGAEAMAHDMRTDTAGARPIPADVLEEWLSQRLLARVELPEVPPGEYRPGRVFDPFMGSGTCAVAAQQLNREVWGSELSPSYVRIAAARAGRWWKRPRAPQRRDLTGQGSLLDELEVAPAQAD